MYLRHLRSLAPRTVIYRNWQDVRQLVILYESDLMERNQDIKDMAALLREQDKQVTLVGFAPVKEVQSPALPQSVMFGLKDFNIWKQPCTALSDDISRHAHDLLLDLTPPDSAYRLQINYLVTLIQADLKAGASLSNEADNIHDFLLSVPSSLSGMQLYEQLVNYLQMIKSHE